MSDLDAIDRAYEDIAHPLFVLFGGKASAGQRRMLESLALRSHMSAVVVPDGYTVELLPPQVPHPFELARWADDGGPV